MSNIVWFWRVLALVGVAVWSSGCGGSATSGQRATESAADANWELPKERASYGVVVVEAVEDDGEGEQLGVDQGLVIHPDEIRAGIPLMAAAETAMAFFVQAHWMKRPEAMEHMFSLMEEANAAGVPVQLLPVLDVEEGYFPNATNADSFAAFVRELSAEWTQRGLAPTTMFVDMEPPRELTEALSSFQLLEAMPRKHIDEARFERARGVYAELVDELHADGWTVVCTTQGSLLADYRDGDDDMRQYFNVVIEGVDWDRIDFQLYRSLFSSQASGLGPFFVYAFSQYARAIFPDMPVGVAVGVTHPGPIFPDMPSLERPADLGDDVAAALAAGIERDHIGVYNLKGILEGAPQCDKLLGCEGSEYSYGMNDPAAWFVTAVAKAPSDDDGATEGLWDKLDLMDELLNLSEAGGSDE